MSTVHLVLLMTNLLLIENVISMTVITSECYVQWYCEHRWQHFDVDMSTTPFIDCKNLLKKNLFSNHSLNKLYDRWIFPLPDVDVYAGADLCLLAGGSYVKNLSLLRWKRDSNFHSDAVVIKCAKIANTVQPVAMIQ